MAEQWKLFLQKSSQNIESSRILFEKEFYGLSAYNAQQAIEQLVKAYVLRFNLLDPETSNIFKTHLPSKILLRDVYMDLVEFFNKTNIRAMDYLMERMFEISMKMLERTRKIMKLVDKDKDALKDLWKLSLGLKVNESKVQNYFEDYEKTMEETIPFELVEANINFMQNLFKQVLDQVRKERKSHLIPMIMSEFKQKCVEKNLPEDMYEIYTNKFSRVNLHKKLESYGQRLDSMDMIDLVFGEGGTIEMFDKIKSKKKDFLEGIDYKRHYQLMYITHLRMPILLSYPHEVFGRYSEIIDGRSTDEWYKLQSGNVENIINVCAESQRKIERFLLQ